MSKAAPRYSQGRWPASTSLCSSGKWYPGSGYQAGSRSSWSRYCPQKERPHSPVPGSHRYKDPAAGIHSAVPLGTAPKTAPREMWEVGGSKRPLETDENLMSEATTILVGRMELSHSENIFFFWTMWMKICPLCSLTIRPGVFYGWFWQGISASFSIVSLLLLQWLVQNRNENIWCVNDEWKKIEWIEWADVIPSW